jgi:hypothetical protein
MDLARPALRPGDRRLGDMTALCGGHVPQTLIMCSLGPVCAARYPGAAPELDFSPTIGG